MFFDRFDIVEAYYIFFVNYHTGLNSIEYARLSKMRKYFRPAINLSVDSLSENSLDIYNNLVNNIKG